MDEEEDLVTNLPQEMMVDILSRLPISTIISCRCVCKSWRDLIKGSEFATSHLAKSTSWCMVVVEDVKSEIKPYKICAFEDDDDDDDDEIKSSTTTRVISHFGLPRKDYKGSCLHISVNGLLLLIDRDYFCHHLSICNPITREYMELPPPRSRLYLSSLVGFGASKVSGRYKIVIVFWELINNRPRHQCEVYTLGTGKGQWRSIDAKPINRHCFFSHHVALSFNGILHWVSHDSEVVSCFHLETEHFTSLSTPPADPHNRRDHRWLSTLEGRLCLSDSTSDKIHIWFMNKYGDDNSWVNAFSIDRIAMLQYPYQSVVYPVKLFKGGEILFHINGCRKLFSYSKNTKAIREHGGLLPRCSYFSTKLVYTPTFVSLKGMGFQDCHVQSF